MKKTAKAKAASAPGVPGAVERLTRCLAPAGATPGGDTKGAGYRSHGRALRPQGSYRFARFWMVLVDRPVISLITSTEKPFVRAFLAISTRPLSKNLSGNRKGPIKEV
jgi:hypothetical protein